MLLALVTSLLLSPIYYTVNEVVIGAALNVFSLMVFLLQFASQDNDFFVRNSRLFMLSVFGLFFVFFSQSDQALNSTPFLLLYPIASFSIRGPKEGMAWAFLVALIFIATYWVHPEAYNLHSFVFFMVAYFMVSYLLYYYRFYEFLNFQEINQNLEREVAQRTLELNQKNKELQKISVTDPLTGLYNRLKLDETLAKETARTDRYHHAFGIIVFDVDDFKSVNDGYGHQVGDTLLKAIAKIAEQCVRSTDVVGRWGGEEFMIICPETTLADTLAIAEKLRRRISDCRFEEVGQKTASFGVGLYQKNHVLATVIARLDEALYQAKNSGKNRVCSSADA